jgi:hypothetical protein
MSHQLVIQNMCSTRIIPQVHCPRLRSRSPGSLTIVKSSPRKEEDKTAEGVGKAKVRGKRKNTSANGRGGEAKKKRLSARSVSCSYYFGRGPCRLSALLIIRYKPPSGKRSDPLRCKVISYVRLDDTEHQRAPRTVTNYLLPEIVVSFLPHHPPCSSLKNSSVLGVPVTEHHDERRTGCETGQY